jgi:hypothetical protein
MTHYFDPPGWITDRTYELHKGGLSYDADRKQAEAEADDKFGAEEGSDLKSEPSELLRRSVTACNSPLMADERCALVLAGDSDAANAIDTQRAMRLMLTELNEAEDTYEAVLDEFGDCARCLRGAR